MASTTETPAPPAGVTSPAARILLRIPGSTEPLPMGFFFATLTVQGVFAFALTRPSS